MLNNKDIYFMEIAYKQALLAKKKNEIPVGAVIVKNEEEIISTGYNMCELYNNSILHAEMIALKKAILYKKNWRLNTETIYITLEPCLMCLGALLNARIKRIVFSVRDIKRINTQINTYEILKYNVFNHIVEVDTGILEEKCKKLLLDFFYSIRNKHKIYI